MIQSKLFQRLVILSIIGVVAFMFIGFASSIFINQYIEEDESNTNRINRKNELVVLSLKNIPHKQRKHYIEQLNRNEEETFSLIEETNKDACGSTFDQECTVYKIDEKQSLMVSRLLPGALGMRGPPPPPGPPGMSPPPGHPFGMIPPPRGGGRQAGGPPVDRLILTAGVQFVAMIVCVVVLMILVFLYAKKRREVGEEVFERIKNGELDARFPISRVDDFGTNTKLFNEMADEIMGLILKLEKKDINRKRLFKTLAHDLKTPAASLKGIMETLVFRRNELTEEQRDELYKMSSQEIDYFSALLDDILFLAKVQDPEFKTHKGSTDLVSSLRDLCDTVSFVNKDITINFSTNTDELLLPIEQSHLMRLFRNALDNAVLYGDSKVDVTIRVNSNINITVTNDGSGFDSETIKFFGTMKTARTRLNAQGSLSFGMGSVIMTTIVEGLGGSIRPENVLCPSGEVIGAKLKIIIDSSRSRVGSTVSKLI